MLQNQKYCWTLSTKFELLLLIAIPLALIQEILFYSLDAFLNNALVREHLGLCGTPKIIA
jgi:hypothetical protein